LQYLCPIRTEQSNEQASTESLEKHTYQRIARIHMKLYCKCSIRHLMLNSRNSQLTTSCPEKSVGTPQSSIQTPIAKARASMVKQISIIMSQAGQRFTMPRQQLALTIPPAKVMALIQESGQAQLNTGSIEHSSSLTRLRLALISLIP